MSIPTCVRSLLCIAFSTLIPVPFAPTASANTSILIVRTEQASIIAADSKESLTQGPDTRLICKIHITSNVIWATTGIVRNPNGTFDIWSAAQSAIAKGGSLDDIVSEFESNAASQLKQVLASIKSVNPESYEVATKTPYVATAAFIQNNALEFTYFLLPDKQLPENIEVVRHKCPGQDCPAGQLTVMMGEHQAIDAELERYPDVWRDKGLVGAINFLVGVQSSATPTTVGGPASILRIHESGSLEWLQKGTCD